MAHGRRSLWSEAVLTFSDPPCPAGRWRARPQTSSADAFSFLFACLILLAILGYAVLAALCYGARLLLLKALRFLLRAVRWLGSPEDRLSASQRRGDDAGGGRESGDGVRGGRVKGFSASYAGGSNGGRPRPGSLSPRTEAARTRAAAAVALPPPGSGGGVGRSGLWDEALMTLLGGPGPPDPFPEDSFPELDGPAIDRQPAPGVGSRNGGVGSSLGGVRSGPGANGTAGTGGGGRGGGDGGSSSGTSAGGGRSRGHHPRSPSGEFVVWPTAPNDGRGVDLRWWGNGGGGGGGGYPNGNSGPHCVKRFD